MGGGTLARRAGPWQNGRMNRTAALALTAALLLPLAPARAAEAEAKEVARSSNCKPGKVEVVRRVTGSNGETIYKIACTDQKDSFVLVRCYQRTCLLAR